MKLKYALIPLPEEAVMITCTVARVENRDFMEELDRKGAYVPKGWEAYLIESPLFQRFLH